MEQQNNSKKTQQCNDDGSDIHNNIHNSYWSPSVTYIVLGVDVSPGVNQHLDDRIVAILCSLVERCTPILFRAAG